MENEWLAPIGPLSRTIHNSKKEIERMSSFEKTRLCVAVSVHIEENPKYDHRTYNHAAHLETREFATVAEAREFYKSVIETLSPAFAKDAVSGASEATTEQAEGG
jgi:hypothetical protein